MDNNNPTPTTDQPVTPPAPAGDQGGAMPTPPAPTPAPETPTTPGAGDVNGGTQQTV